MTSLLPPVAPSLQDRLRAAQPCLWTNPDRSATVAPQLSVGTAMVGVQDIQAASQRFARCAGLLATLFPEHGIDVNTLMRHADVAMYNAKEAGRSQFKLFNPAMITSAEQSGTSH